MEKREKDRVPNEKPAERKLCYLSQKMLEDLDKPTDWDEIHRTNLLLDQRVAEYQAGKTAGAVIPPFVFEKAYDVRFYDCDCTGQIKLSAVLRYLSDLAERHYDAKGFGHDVLWEKEMAFLLAGESLRFHRRPRGNERLTFTTWEREIKGARYFRDFEIYDETGVLVVSASTVWLLANPVTRRILRPDVCDFRPDLHPERKADVLPDGKPGKGDEPVFLGRREVRFSDLDNNLHVYNANYADMALDALPPEEACAPLRDFRIRYVSEARQGDVLLLSRATLPDGGVLVQGEKESGGLCFACELRK